MQKIQILFSILSGAVNQNSTTEQLRPVGGFLFYHFMSLQCILEWSLIMWRGYGHVAFHPWNYSDLLGHDH